MIQNISCATIGAVYYVAYFSTHLGYGTTTGYMKIKTEHIFNHYFHHTKQETIIVEL
ncbi:hypothetical protein [Algoriella xinjiangensis]|uniref:hypothetical protein n=1 Tax=Algoriella xinjiangensis TaxID=684065 RepID=UPI0015A50F8C|nr:hypothetical protein [Algoriella xinjiangensis]